MKNDESAEVKTCWLLDAQRKSFDIFKLKMGDALSRTCSEKKLAVLNGFSTVKFHCMILSIYLNHLNHEVFQLGKKKEKQ